MDNIKKIVEDEIKKKWLEHKQYFIHQIEEAYADKVFITKEGAIELIELALNHGRTCLIYEIEQIQNEQNIPSIPFSYIKNSIINIK